MACNNSVDAILRTDSFLEQSSSSSSSIDSRRDTTNLPILDEDLLSSYNASKVCIDIEDLTLSEFDNFLSDSSFYKKTDLYNTPCFYKEIQLYDGYEVTELHQEDRCFSGNVPLKALVMVYEFCKNYRNLREKSKMELLYDLEYVFTMYDVCCYFFNSKNFRKVLEILLHTFESYIKDEKTAHIKVKLRHLFQDLREKRNIDHIEVYGKGNGWSRSETIQELRNEEEQGIKEKIHLLVHKIETECDVPISKL